MRALNAALGLIASAALLAGSGCGDDDPPETPSDPGAPLVVYERGGGIAGVAERLEVSDDGTATLTVGSVDEQHTEFRLSDAELERLTAELEAAEFEAVGTDGPNSCADCFIDRITYAGEATTIMPEVDDVPESVGTLLTELRGLVGSA